MLPQNNQALQQNFKIEEPPTNTFRLNLVKNKISGFTDGLDGIKQAVYLILNVERYEYLIYSWNYGVELADLFGEPIAYICPELERRIREALLQDSRITGVENFVFDTSQKGQLKASFTVQTIFGEFVDEKEVFV